MRDLRDWLTTLEAAGELSTITARVDREGEIQEIGRQLVAGKGPAALFERIEGHEDTFCRRLFVGGLATRARLAMALGLPRDADPSAVVARLRATLRTPVDPVLVDSGPVQENVLCKGDIDLRAIPVPRWHPGDRGRYINTWAAVVTRDPDTGSVNVGAYRGVIHDRDHIGVLLLGSQGWGLHYQKYVERQQDMPVACVYGWDPTLMLAAGAPVTTCDEWQWIGALRNEPVPLVPCQTVPLQVPATAELAVEGTISWDRSRFRTEGPFKERSGRYGETYNMPSIAVSAITYRNDPIMVGSVTGIAPLVEEQSVVIGATARAILLNALQDAGVPGVLDLSLAPFFGLRVKKSYEGHAFQAACALFGHKALNAGLKTLVVVDDAVDLNDPAAVAAAINANIHPERDVHVFPTHRAIVDSAIPLSADDCQVYGGAPGSKLLLDATVSWAAHPPGQRRPPEPPPPEDVDRVRQRWAAYGLGPRPTG